MVEHDLAKVGVEGSNPFARSNYFQGLAAEPHAAGWPESLSGLNFWNGWIFRSGVAMAAAAWLACSKSILLNHEIGPSSPNSEIRLAPKLKALVALSTLRR